MSYATDWMNGLSDDYGLAVLVDGHHDSEYMIERLRNGYGVPFLSMATGKGILRALEVRMGPIMVEGAMTLCAVKKADGCATFQVFNLESHTPKPEPEPPVHCSQNRMLDWAKLTKDQTA